MTFTSASSLSVLSFMLIVVGIIAVILWATYHAYRHYPSPRIPVFIMGAGIGLFLGIVAAVVALEILLEEPSRVLFFFNAIMATVVITALSPVGRKLALETPLVALVAFQSFRLPLELVLHEWAAQRTIPETMTWTGQNYDIISGLMAIGAGIWLYKRGESKRVAWVVNITGIVLLANVLRVVVMSSPLPFAWQVEPPLQLAMHLPYALIAPVCVGGAVFGHIALTRRLLWRAR